MGTINKIDNITKISEQNEYKILDEKKIIEKWKNFSIDNYQFLLYLNKYSGRTFNDINQYPIFPWITLSNDFINNKDIENNDENNNIIGAIEEEKPKIIFRDMNHFMTTQTKRGKEKAIANYKFSEDDTPGKGSHFTLHYSTGGFILLYLMRVTPFRDAHLLFQGGDFDDPNRLLNNIDELLLIIRDSKDNRELVPEYLTTCEFCYNLNYIYYGLRKQQNIVINDLNVSKFYNSIEKYIYYNRLLLNNNKDTTKKYFPKCPINNWINLVFGYKQYPTSMDDYNKFPKYTYRQEKNLLYYLEKYKNKGYEDNVIMKKIFTKKSLILNFGQCPLQLFDKSLIEPNESSHNHNQNHKNKILDISRKDIKIITFWLSENSSHIFFLTKNTQNKTMKILIYDEKFNKKSEITIDKIKLFNCQTDYRRKEDEKEIKYDWINDITNMSKKKLEKINNKEEDESIIYLSELYLLNPRDGIMDICYDDNIYLFIGRYKNNSIKIYSIDEKTQNGKLIGIIKADSFISVIAKKDSKSFFTGHRNGKLIEWEIESKEIMKQNTFFSTNLNIISNIIFKREIIAHNYTMITSINYNERYNIILTSDDKGFLFIRKYYDFELLTKIQINTNNDDLCFINKIFLTNYDIICTINYNTQNYNKYISFYSINGIFLEKSDYLCCIDSKVLQNGKIILIV